jgi:hypothetical protein
MKESWQMILVSDKIGFKTINYYGAGDSLCDEKRTRRNAGSFAFHFLF